jgi:TonB-linked SusC/RagA family outer membrane protein
LILEKLIISKLSINQPKELFMKRILLISFVLMAALISEAWAQRTVSGTVTSSTDGEGMPGVTVRAKGTSTGVNTDFDGNYRLQVPEGSNTLVFSFVGFTTQEVAIGNRSVVDVVLEEDLKQLEEVVVVGYGTQSERFSTQSISTINNAEFERMPITSAQEALQGQAAGVQLVGTSGVAGAQQNIRIRGVASLTAGGSPLFVVDGVPMNDASGITGGYSNSSGAVPLNPLQELNPNEIKSISVLKDASAVAIYGSRGANGVILIETKKGVANQSRINADFYTGIQEPTTVRPYMSLSQFNQLYSARTGTPIEDLPQEGFDWPEAIVQQGEISNMNLSASGGSESTRYFLSGTYLKQNTYAIGNELDRMNARLNVTHDFSDRATVGANLGLAQTNNNRISSDNSTYAPLTSAFLHSPWNLPYDEDGNYTRLGFIPNILAIEDLSTSEFITRRTTGNIFFELEVVKNLKFRSDIGTDQVQTEETFRYPDIVSATGYGYKRIIQDLKWLNTNTLNYENNFGQDHYVSALLGQSYEESDFSSIAVEGSGFVSDALPNVASAATPTTTSATSTGWKLSSLFSRLNYRFRDKYLLEGSLRRDGSSRFGLENRYGVFWAVSGGWILSEESFLQGIEQLDLLKLNVSYGTAGNDKIDNFASLGLYAGGSLGDYAGQPGLYPTQAANPLLGWEETEQFDITLSTAFLSNRLEFEASYWNKETTGLLLDVPVPYTTGYSSITRNAGVMRNSGVDLLLKTLNVATPGGFEWRTNFNVGFLDNEILSLPGASEDAEGRRFVTGSSSQRAIEGYSANTFYLVRYKGVNPETGDAEWLTKDGEVTTSPTAEDRVIIGSAIPDFTGGITNTFSYKGLELSAFLTFVQGNYIMYDDLRFLFNARSGFNKDPRLLDYWQEPGDNSFAPALDSPTFNSFPQRSTQQLRKGDYLRLRNLSLTYNLPKGLLEKTQIVRSARVYAMAQNWFTWSYLEEGLEPEISDGGSVNLRQGESFFTPPQAKTITVGVSIGL